MKNNMLSYSPHWMPLGWYFDFQGWKCMQGGGDWESSGGGDVDAVRWIKDSSF